MTTDDQLDQEIRAWHDHVGRIDAALDALGAVVGSDPECTLQRAVWDAVSHYTEVLERRHGVPGDLDYWLWECQRGHGFEAAGVQVDGRFYRLRTVGDLVNYLQETRRGN